MIKAITAKLISVGIGYLMKKSVVWLWWNM